MSSVYAIITNGPHIIFIKHCLILNSQLIESYQAMYSLNVADEFLAVFSSLSDGRISEQYLEVHHLLL